MDSEGSLISALFWNCVSSECMRYQHAMLHQLPREHFQLDLSDPPQTLHIDTNISSCIYIYPSLVLKIIVLPIEQVRDEGQPYAACRPVGGTMQKGTWSVSDGDILL